MSTEETIIGGLRGIPVGRGGFATVYRATDDYGRVFALKLADPEADEAIKASLYHEYSVQSELVHPQIVRAHRFGLHEQRPYLVLDWIDGPPVFDFAAVPTADDFIALLRQTARALLFVHHRGWVHGDLKPENFRWRSTSTDGTAGPELCILDFGLARRVGDANRPRGAGTVGYCAPEFLNSQPADGRADWYSVGVMLYEWIFGVRPYAADEPAIEIAGHLEGTPDFSLERRRPAPDWADQLITRLLAKTPDERADDEMALLAHMAEFDPALEPTALLNDQLRWHARSATRVLRSHEAALLDVIADDLRGGRPAYLSLASHGMASGAWIDRAAAICTAQGYEVEISHDADAAYRVLDVTSSRHAPRVDIRLEGRLSGTSSDRRIADYRFVSMLPWDRQEVHSYLDGIVGDEDVAEAWTDAILTATCGLPAAVVALLQHLIEAGALSVDADGWGMDEFAVAAWRDSNAIGEIAVVLGEVDSSEKLLCQWLALGEGSGNSMVLRELWGSGHAELSTTLAELIARGFIARETDAPANTFDVRLRLPGHAAILRTQMPSQEIRDRSRLLAAALESQALVPESTRAETLGHVYGRAENWERSAEECLRAATLAIKIDDRERAMHYIGLAQDAASRITDSAARAHWLGHSRMVEGDLQKAAGQLDAARKTYRELLALCRVTRDRRLLGETLHDLADLYYVTRRYHKGISSERQALKIWESLGDRAQISRSLNSLGNLHRLVSEFEHALGFYHQAIEIQTALGLEQFAATNLNNIGIIHWLRYDFPQAETYFRRSLAIQERLNVPVEVARCLNNLGTLAFEQGMPETSEELYTRAATLNSGAGAQSEEMFNRWNLIDVALELGDLKSASNLGHQVFNTCVEIGELATAAEASAELADTYFRAGDDRRAKHFQADCLARSAALNNDDLQVHLALHSAERELRFRRYDRALSILEPIVPHGIPAVSRYRYLDVLIVRARIFAALQDTAAIHEIWEFGAREAETLSATHKEAHLAYVCLSSGLAPELSDWFAHFIADFLTARPRWHWAPSFHLWNVRRLKMSGELDAALTLVTAVVAQLRRDGCWEKLWRALVIQGEICHAQADYEPAVRALDEAARTLKVVVSTVDDDTERSAYLDCDDARVLERIRERIAQLVS